jgi:transposase
MPKLLRKLWLWCTLEGKRSNLIEQVFAKLKHLLRNACPRTVEDTWRKVGALVDLFSPQECANYLKNSGYAAV